MRTKTIIMKITGRYSKHEEIEANPEKPFLKDLRKDLYIMSKYYNKTTCKAIKIKMIDEILKDI